MAAVPPQRSMSQLDCHPPMLDFWVVGWLFIRSSMTRRSSMLSAAASGTSNTTSGVANSGTTSGTLFIRGAHGTPAGRSRVVQSSHGRMMHARVTRAWHRGGDDHEAVCGASTGDFLDARDQL